MAQTCPRCRKVVGALWGYFDWSWCNPCIYEYQVLIGARVPSPPK